MLDDNPKKPIKTACREILQNEEPDLKSNNLDRFEREIESLRSTYNNFIKDLKT